MEEMAGSEGRDSTGDKPKAIAKDVSNAQETVAESLNQVRRRVPMVPQHGSMHAKFRSARNCTQSKMSSFLCFMRCTCFTQCIQTLSWRHILRISLKYAPYASQTFNSYYQSS